MKASSVKQLNVRGDRAYKLAHEIARRQKRTTQDIVLQALEAYAKAQGIETVDEEAAREAEYQRLMAVARKYRKKWRKGETEDHDFLYDENGLPK